MNTKTLSKDRDELRQLLARTGLKVRVTKLEVGYVYVPYVPLILTPIIYPEDNFTPRKGVMTRYSKNLVRSDFYGTTNVE